MVRIKTKILYQYEKHFKVYFVRNYFIPDG